MDATYIIRKPAISEKSTWGSSEQNRYTFEVDRRATKPQIRRAVEELYGVRVLKVATQNRNGLLKRNKHGHWRAARKKLAVVRIHEEDRIELF